MQEQLDKIKEHISRIPNSYKQPEECAFLIRSALALSIHVFYYKKYGMIVDIPSSLNDAIKDTRFKNAFYDRMVTLSDIQSIRISCNGIIHPTNFVVKYSEQDMVELYNRLLKCISVIEEKAGIKILNNICVNNQPKNTNDDKKAKIIFENTGLKENQILHISGIREFVQKYFKQSTNATNSIMSARWIIPWFNKEIVWVVSMVKNKPLSQTNNWVNVDNGDEIIEIPPKGKNTFDKKPIREYATEHPYRIVVEKIMNGLIVKGVYKFNETKSINDLEHYYTKI